MEKVEVIKADFDWIKVGERYFRETFPERGGRVRDIGDKVEYSYGTQTATISKDDLSEWIWDKLSMEKNTIKEIEIDWVEYGKTYFKVLLGADVAIDVVGESVRCVVDGTAYSVNKKDISSWLWNKRIQDEIARDAEWRREDRIWKQTQERGWVRRFGTTDDTLSEAQGAPMVRPLLVLSFKQSLTSAMLEAIRQKTEQIERRTGWAVVVLDCQDEAKVRAFAPGLPDINAMNTDEAIASLEALLEGLKRWRDGDGGG